MENMNERTNAEHIAAQALETVLVGKVDKEDGKGLSSNDYTDAEKEKLAGIPALDYASLEEQIIPGEFWLGTDGVKRQVYFRTFRGTTPLAVNGYSFSIKTLEPLATSVQYIKGTIDGYPQGYLTSSAGVSFNNNLYWSYDAKAGLRVMGAEAPITNPTGTISNNLGNKLYDLTFKYTKD